MAAACRGRRRARRRCAQADRARAGACARRPSAGARRRRLRAAVWASVVLPEPDTPPARISTWGAAWRTRRHRQMAREVLERVAHPWFVSTDLARADERHLGAHHRPVHEIEAQHVDARVVAARLEYAIEKAPAECRRAAIDEIHHRERDLAHDVDPAKRIVELDAVEQHAGRRRCGRRCPGAGRRGIRARTRLPCVVRSARRGRVTRRRSIGAGDAIAHPARTAVRGARYA